MLFSVKENLNIANKKLQFVNIIRDDLRRNNDDYALVEQQNDLPYPVPLAHPPQPQPAAARSPYRKRMLPSGTRPQPPRLYYGDTRRGKGDVNQSTKDDNAFKSYTHSKHYKIERANNLKRLLNRDKLRMRVGKQIEEDTAINTLPETNPTPSLRTPTPRPPPRHTSPPPPPQETEQEAPVLRHRKDKSPSPSPDQLDMAAARNPQLTRIRLKVLNIIRHYRAKASSNTRTLTIALTVSLGLLTMFLLYQLRKYMLILSTAVLLARSWTHVLFISTNVTLLNRVHIDLLLSLIIYETHMACNKDLNIEYLVYERRVSLPL